MDNNHPTSGPAIAGDQKAVIAEPMAPDVLEALRGSIAKWEKIVAGTEEDRGDENCPLCQLFFGTAPFCKGCPVMARTGKSGCRNSPYDDYVAFRGGEPTTENAQAELDFLKSLLPESAS